MAGKIFINYRRELSQGQAQHLASVLARTFGKNRVFIDIHGIDGFSDWLRVLKEQVAGTAAMISVIGPGWLNVADKRGGRRLDNPKDFVRFEIAEALGRDIPVLPVLLDGAALPSREELPEEMRGMLRWQTMDLHAKRFDADARLIANALKAQMRKPRGVSLWIATGAAAIALCVGIYLGPAVLTRIGVDFPWVETRTNAWFEKTIAAARAAAQAIAAEAKTAKESAERAEAARKEAADRLAKAEGDLAGVNSDLSEARAELDRTKTRSGELATDLKEALDHLRDAEARVEAAEAANGRANAELAKFRDLPSEYVFLHARLGLALMAGVDGVIISEVASNSEASEKGLKAGDVIQEVGGKSVSRLSEVVSGYKDAHQKGRKAILIQIRSDGQSRFVALSLNPSK